MRNDDHLERLRAAYEAAYVDRDAVLTMPHLWASLGWLRTFLCGIERPEEVDGFALGCLLLRLRRPWCWVPGAAWLMRRWATARVAHRMPVGTYLEVR